MVKSQGDNDDSGRILSDIDGTFDKTKGPLQLEGLVALLMWKRIVLYVIYGDTVALRLYLTLIVCSLCKGWYLTV